MLNIDYKGSRIIYDLVKFDHDKRKLMIRSPGNVHRIDMKQASIFNFRIKMDDTIFKLVPLKKDRRCSLSDIQLPFALHTSPPKRRINPKNFLKEISILDNSGIGRGRIADLMGVARSTIYKIFENP